MNVPVDYLGVQARLQPGRLAAAELASGRTWSYRQLDEDVGRCARVLVERGLGLGDRVVSLARNRVLLIMLHLACARIGAVYAPLNWRLSPAEIRALVEDAAPTLVVGDQELARAEVAGAALDELWAQVQVAEPLALRPVDRDRPSLILYTSGTSGRPKGVLLTERNLDQTASNFGRLGRVTHNSVFLNDSPMFHVIGMVTTIRPPLAHGGAVLISDGFDPARTLARLGDPALGVTHYFCVPQMATMLRVHPTYDPAALGGLTGLFTGGAPNPGPDIRAWLADGVPMVDGFGMTEAGTVLGMPIDPEGIAQRAGSAGVPMPGVRVRLVDGQDQPVAVGAPGELQLQGANLFAGYWRLPEETQAAFTEDGWFRTGDIAVADAEGFHWLVDRKKDMFISGGENIFPAEIEAALAGHPAIAECAVVGLPDPRWGEVGHVALVLKPGASLDHAQILAHLEPRLARYKLPKGLTILQTLPRTGSGKVQKPALRTLLLKRLHA